MKKLYLIIKPVLGKLLIEALFLVIIVISFIYHKRIILFTKLFNNLFFNMSIVPLIIYYFGLFGIFFYNIVYLGLFFTKRLDDSLISIDKKTDIAQYIFKCIVLIFTVLMYIITPCTVIGPSMENTLHSKDRVITYNLFYSPEDGDIVVFSARKNHNNEDFYIKRVIARENDLLEYNIDSNELYVNSSLVATITMHEYLMITENSESLSFVIPKDKVMVFGDNRGNSADSRYFGLIDKGDIFGKVILRIFPSFGGIEPNIKY